MGQDDRCGWCGKGTCNHMKHKEHAGYVHRLTGNTASVCGRKGIIVIEPDVDGEITCKQCQRIIHNMDVDYRKSRKKYIKALSLK